MSREGDATDLLGLHGEYRRLTSQVANLRRRSGFPEALGFDFNQGDEGSAYGMRVLDRSMGALTVASSTTRTLVYGFTLPQLAMGPNGMFRVTAAGIYSNNAGAGTQTYTLDIEFGGTIIWQATADEIGDSTAIRLWSLNADLTNINDQAVNFLSGVYATIVGTHTASVGYGGLETATDSAFTFRLGNETTIDTRHAPMFGLYVTLSHNNASFYYTRKFGRTEILP